MSWSIPVRENTFALGDGMRAVWQPVFALRMASKQATNKLYVMSTRFSIYYVQLRYATYKYMSIISRYNKFRNDNSGET